MDPFSFSKRVGAHSVPPMLQVESMDAFLRTAIWNAFYETFGRSLQNELHYPFRIHDGLSVPIWNHFLRKPADELLSDPGHFLSFTKAWVFKTEWQRVYDLVEFVLELNFDILTTAWFRQRISDALTSERSGFRLVHNTLVPITSPAELASIETACSIAGEWTAARDHMIKARDLFADRSAPDFQNSIKESVSALESACRVILGDSKIVLSKSMPIVAKRLGIHPALETSISKLYAFASDASGVRHSSSDGPQPGRAEAQAVLVAASAFLGYLQQRATTHETS